jgi:hypothetical protein
MFLVQRLSLVLLTKLCSEDRNLSGTCWQYLNQEFEKNGMCSGVCSTQGDLYEEKEIEITLP